MMGIGGSAYAHTWTVLVVAAAAVFLVRRSRQPQAPHDRWNIIRPPVIHELPGAEQPAIGQPRELHLHFHGAAPEQVAEVLHRHQRPE